MGQENVYGVGIEFEHFFKTRVVQGLLFGPPTSDSTQVTGDGASDFNVNIGHGLALIDGEKYELAAAADYDMASDAAALIDAGESIVYTFLLYRSHGDGLVYFKEVLGTAAATGSEAAPTDAEIEGLFPGGTVWLRLADCTVNRDGTDDTVITQTYDNTVRLQRAATIHKSS